jgi:hypothetical protein
LVVAIATSYSQSVTESNDVAEVEEYRPSWVLRGVYAVLIGANLWLAYDWWRDTPQGSAVVERWRAKIAAAKEKAENCEGCARRKAWLQKQTNRMHWQAEEIVTEAAETAEPGEPA